MENANKKRPNKEQPNKEQPKRKTIYIDRPPRIQPELPFNEIEIPRPPDKSQDRIAQLLQALLPVLTIVGTVMMASMGGSAWMIIPMALSMVGSIGFSIYSYRKDQERIAQLTRDYDERLIELNTEMHTYHDLQRRFYDYNYPDASSVYRIVQSAPREAEKSERTLRSETRLWERRASDQDFGTIRLGMGALPSTVVYRVQSIDNPDDPQARAALKLQDDSLFVHNIPVVLSLRQTRKQEDTVGGAPKTNQSPPMPFAHAVGIAGENVAVYEFVRALAIHYAAFHQASDARLYILGKSPLEWEWATHLPHSKPDLQGKYLHFTDQKEAEEGEKNLDEVDGDALDRYLEGLRKVLSQRKIRTSSREDHETAAKDDPTFPHLLVIIDLLESTYDKKARLNNLEADAAISILLEEGASLGATVIFLGPERAKLPSRCTSVIEVERTTPATNSQMKQDQKLHFRYAEIGVNSTRYVGEANLIDQPNSMARMAQIMAQLEVRQGFGANLPASVSFFDLMNLQGMPHLLEKTWQNWQDYAKPGRANWLHARIGIMSGNKPRTLVFSAKRDGVHGMVAGSTGSGKSELLISLIAAMAVTYEPSVLNFVLVDFKGGGAFKGFDELPHCVDIITNLQGDAVTRMFTAINAEIQRRQKLNADTNTKNIVDYRQKGLHETLQPYPFLFIIIDEFAEMIAERPEYKTQLETITRVGRAQGVSLILAAQRPSGVTDQMRSNIKFRISLRVETSSESREMLRREDAAFLPSIPGRGYLQVGNDEIELIQVAYTGEKYIDPNRRIVPVYWPQRGDKYDPTIDQEPPELYRAIVLELEKLAQERGIPKQSAPWPGFLPRKLALTELLISDDPKRKTVTARRYLTQIERMTLGQRQVAHLTLNPALNRWHNGDDSDNGWLPIDNPKEYWSEYAARPVVGLVDDPEAAKQLPLVIEFQRGHVVIFGASGWGKTAFLRTLAMSLMAAHSPNHLWLYLLDMGGRSLSVLSEFPHVGAVIIPDEVGFEERVEQMFRTLDELIEKRKTLLSEAGADDIYKYNIANPSQAEPVVVVAIDNILEFKEVFDRGEDNIDDAMKKFISMSRQSKLFGIHFVITASKSSDLTTQTFSIFTERLTLKLADPTEPRTIVGGYVGEIPDVAGRGYIKIGPKPLSFQVALPLELNEGDNEAKQLEQVALTMSEYMERTATIHWNRPIKIDPLPRSILFKQLLARQWKRDLGDQFLTTLREQTWRNWQESLDASKADWLQVMLGALSGNRPRTMHFRADKDGVHGMIAGGTGSGKSELLMTLIVGMAINYDPSILNFVLVDFKGGGAFTPFKDLPHCVDMVTNLNKSAVRRFFTAINAEMSRRQKLNTDTATKHIVEYREKGLHKTFAPYPHLFVIIDEYAEMISSNPEYKAELESIARLGRAQGVNLLLAAQRPTGVTDQMRANIKYRICLRVEELDTSREMLRRTDAALLPSIPGRGYLQVGNDGIELIQTAYTGEEMKADFEMPDGRAPKFYDVVVHLGQELLQRAGLDRPDTPWPPFLSSHLTLSDSVAEKYLNKDHLPLMLTPHPGTQRLAANDSETEFLQKTRFLAAGNTQHNPVAQGKRPIPLNPFVQEWMAGRIAWHGIDWNRTALRGIIGIVDAPADSCQLPLTLDFSKGHVIVFGGSGYGKTTLIRSLVVSLAATHSPDEFHAHLLDLGGRNLEVLKALPHVGTVIMPDEQGFEEQVQQLWRELNEEIDRRKRKFSDASVSTLYEYNGLNTSTTLRTSPQRGEPAILVAIDNFGEYIETFGKDINADDESSPMGQFVSLARQAKSYGIHFLVTVPRYNTLSNNLHSLFTERLTLRLADPDDYRTILGVGVPEIDETPGRGYLKVGREALEFQVAVPIAERVVQNDQVQFANEFRLIRQLGTQMREVGKGRWNEDRQPLRIGALPKSSSYREVISKLYGFHKDRSFIEQLKASTAEIWQRNALDKQADWLRVTLGIVSGNRPRELYMAAKADGVHGLIAGGTGSGKSELLTTLLCGLVLNYDPTILNFVLVDYKGGGAFKPFAPLPHCVDIVTNLNKAAVRRMFTSINAEIRRRQELNARTGTKDIVDYRSKNLHKTLEAYPHLFIIIDEYAEMIDDNPDYKVELESITRVGRAQGINLLLASQRPKGVTDQMRSNMKLRVCLRVEELDTSREMLRRPDAAMLPSIPGRGYLQVGNEGIELLQASYTGEKQPDDRQAVVMWPNRPDPTTGEGEVPRLFDAIVDLAAEMNQRQMAPKPWPGFLPDRISLQAPLYDAQHNRWFTLSQEVYGAEVVSDWLNGETDTLWPGIDWGNEVLRPTLGLLDHPSEARQEPLRIDLSRTHLAVYGDGATGKTSFLRMLLTSLAVTHSPNELHSYVIDLGGRNFRSLETLPHLGAVLYGDDETFDERLHRLLGRLTSITMQRQQLIADAGANTLYEYNERFPDKALPAILVLIDNFTPLWERYEALLEVTVTPLIRRSLSIGMTFVITANANNNVPSRLVALFGEAITFRQSNFDRYMDIVGRGCVEIDHIPGRGYIRVDRAPLMFQMALPVGFFNQEEGRDSLAEADELRLLCQNMRAYSQTSGFAWREQPAAIQTLPQVVALQKMLDEAGAIQARRIDGVLGENERLLPALFNLKRLGPHFAVCGPPLSGKSTVLYNWVFSLAWRFSPEQVGLVVIDLQNKFFEWGGGYTIGDIPHVIATIAEKEQLVKLSENLRRECEVLFAKQSTREIFVVIDNYEDFSDELEKEWELVRDLASMARRHGRDGVHFIIGGSLTGSGNDLRRQVQASNYGIGLRTEQAVDNLGVARTPPGIRGRELPVGRGYIVKSGEATMIQVATPYELSGLVIADEEERVSLALDGWLRRIIERYPGVEQAQWSQPVAQGKSEAGGGNGSEPGGQAMFDEKTRQLLDLLKNIAAYPQEDGLEMMGDEAENGERPLLDVSSWDDKRVLLKFIGDALQRKTGMDVNAVFGETPDEIVSMALEEFPGVAHVNGNNGDGNYVLDEMGTTDDDIAFDETSTYSEEIFADVTEELS